MPLNIEDSINNLLVNITQEQADIWRENHKEGKVPVEEFIKEFSDYSHEGLISLITAFSMSDSVKGEEEQDIEKAEEDKLDKYYNLIYNRLRKEGYDDEEIEEQIIDNILNTESGEGIDILLVEEIKKIKEINND
jgi:predicted RND superfamily exporter protein